MITRLIGDYFDSYWKWRGCVLANDDCIYSIPLDTDSILKVDPKNGDSTALVIIDYDLVHEEFKWSGSILGPDGCVYGVPFSAPQILRFRPSDQSMTMVGDEMETDHANYAGGAVGRDQKIYFVPARARKILRYDPVEETSSYVGDDVGPLWKCSGAVLGGDGCIYGIPFDSNRVLKFDPGQQNVTFIGMDLGNTEAKWCGGVLGPDGCVYGAPHCSDQILKIDVKKKITSLIGNKDEIRTCGNSNESKDIEQKWSGGVVGMDKCIYFIPFNANKILKLNVETSTTSYLSLDYSDAEDDTKSECQWSGGVLAPDGYIYAMPNSADYVLKIKTRDGWDKVGTYIILRFLVHMGRARPILSHEEGESNDELIPIVKFITDTCDDVFRSTLQSLL